ncbi:unnamed protein product [Orchesella dallaii]|uniref:Odorant receptor n=1 Tax=Orchesella dallaii TaxID=48710 RepID=A0ABP1RTR7_9HEXA
MRKDWSQVDLKILNITYAIGGMFATFSVIAWACSFIDILDPYSIANGISSLSKLEQLFGTQLENILARPNLKFEAYWMWISRSLTVAVGVFAGISCVMPLVFISMPFPIDPFFVTIPLLFPASPTCLLSPNCEMVYNGAIWFSRFVISVISTTTCCRFYAFCFTTCSYVLELQSRCMEKFNRVPSGIKMDMKLFKWYSSLQIVHQSYKESVSWKILILLGDGFIISVVCNVVTLKRYNIPIELYWIAPAVSMLCCVFMALFLPIVAQIDVKSRELIRKRAAYSSYDNDMSFEWKLVRRHFKVMRPITLKFGPFMLMESGIDTVVLEAICTRTIDVVLLQP